MAQKKTIKVSQLPELKRDQLDGEDEFLVTDVDSKNALSSKRLKYRTLLEKVRSQLGLGEYAKKADLGPYAKKDDVPGIVEERLDCMVDVIDAGSAD